MKHDISPQLLQTARALWQLGRWKELLDIISSEEDTGDLSVSWNSELAQYQIQAALQLGMDAFADQCISSARNSDLSAGFAFRATLSSTLTSLARAWCMMGDEGAARSCMQEAVALYPELGDARFIAKLRYDELVSDLIRSGAALRDSRLSHEPRCLFIDAGGYDGCSVLQFLLEEPHFDCVSFEPNPELWGYFEGLPTQLIRKAAYTYAGEIRFTVDPVDFDGSSVIESKRIDFEENVPNADCPVLTVPCMDLSEYVKAAGQRYGRIVLKLDVEGAEYDILEKMLQDDTIDLVETLYCEFHYGKLEISETRHRRVLEGVCSRVRVRDWDALPFSFSRKETRSTRAKRRDRLIRAIYHIKSTTFPRPWPHSRPYKHTMPDKPRPE
ncbi:FkbM family methyltransferase [Lysobacter sp. GX 14042]|uniref:FkbM family methyltransferase n=1 Tax=Lysobacter sp. GX 14042 TaxID=2907155 RepID=UPI001F01DF1E|nr:FkbM family methyltransferase [Lysobacter sp. GX 14042]MCE7032785.1 FkbM family methyltransferase [Lysobacter sp. GX 14042]